MIFMALGMWSRGMIQHSAKIYGTSGMVEWLIQHEAKPSALSRPECHKARKARSHFNVAPWTTSNCALTADGLKVSATALGRHISPTISDIKHT